MGPAGPEVLQDTERRSWAAGEGVRCCAAPLGHMRAAYGLLCGVGVKGIGARRRLADGRQLAAAAACCHGGSEVASCARLLLHHPSSPSFVRVVPPPPPALRLPPNFEKQ